MQRREINSSEAPSSAGGYAQAIELTNNSRMLYISGQIPEGRDGAVPQDFVSQCRLAWRNVEAQLHASGMGLDNLVKVTTFLSDRKYALENREIRNEILAGRQIALTVVIAGIFDESWRLEIVAVAAA